MVWRDPLSRLDLMLLRSSLLLLRSSTAATQQQHRPLARTNKQTNITTT